MQKFSFEVAYETGMQDTVKYTYGDEQKVFPLASVTKMFTAYTILIAVEKQHLSLQDQVLANSATVYNLLTHSSGLQFDSTENIQPVQTSRIYSNTGFELLAEYLEDQTGISFEKYLKENLIYPLRIQEFELAGQAKASKDGWSNIQSLRKFAQELLQPTLISPTLHHYATKQHLHLPGLYLGTNTMLEDHAWALGYELKAGKQNHWMGNKTSPQTYGHFGSAGSFMLIDPNKKVYNIFLGEKPYNSEHRKKWPQLNDELLDLYDQV